MTAKAGQDGNTAKNGKFRKISTRTAKTIQVMAILFWCVSILMLLKQFWNENRAADIKELFRQQKLRSQDSTLRGIRQMTKDQLDTLVHFDTVFTKFKRSHTSDPDRYRRADSLLKGIRRMETEKTNMGKELDSLIGTIKLQYGRSPE